MHQDQQTPRRYGTLAEGSEMYAVSERTLRRMIADGEITGYRFGKRLIRIDLTELEAKMIRIPAAGGAA